MDEEEFQPRKRQTAEITVGEDLTQFSIEELTMPVACGQPEGS